MNARLITKTTGAPGTEYEGKSIDDIIVGIARLSSSREVNELFNEGHKLLRHCILNQHWSIFEMANLTFEVVTSRAMGREFIRHKSISVQEFSQRYAMATEFEPIEIRMQATNNRQSSTEAFDPVIFETVYAQDGEQVLPEVRGSVMVENVLANSNRVYNLLLRGGAARECARMILPETTQTKMYFNGNIRSWISFLNQRLHKTAQKEIRLLAEAIRDSFIQQCPVIAGALFNFEDAGDIHVMERIVLEKYGVYPHVKRNNFKSLKTLNCWE